MSCCKKDFLYKLTIMGVAFSLIAGCSLSTQTAAPTPETTEIKLPPTSTELLPETSPTPPATEIPLAVRINEIEITLQDYQLELDMYQQAKGAEISSEDQQIVLDDLINRALLASTAAEQGFSIDDALIQERIAMLAGELGSEESLSNWMNTYHIDELTFERMLRLSIASAWMRDQIVKAVPESAEQVHVRQILLYDAAAAEDVYQLLQSGNSFRNLALEYDPITGGDLGWLPRGYLPFPAVEEAVFNLEVDQYSQIVESSSGHHILQLLEVDTDRALSPDALQTLQRHALEDWLAQARAENNIEVFISIQ